MKTTNTSKVFPAFAGFYILQAKTDDKDYPIAAFKEPVIGWKIEDESDQPLPLTPSGCDFDPLDILYPDGQVCNPFGSWHESVEDWLKEKQDEYHAKHQKKG